MGIYIHGMEMPKYREIILRIDEKGEVYVYGTYPTELHKAVPVPDHGPLVDALKVVESFPEDHIFTNAQARALMNYVIPAEEGET